MTGAQMVASTLADHGVRAVFGVPGGHNLPLFAAIERAAITTIGGRHEQGAGFMADGWSRITRRPGVVVTTAGPGLTNTLTPLAQAYAELVPLLVLALDNYLVALPEPDGQFHGMTDMRAAVAPFADWVGCPREPAEAGDLVRQAFDRLAGGRTRPLVVQLPSDVLTGESFDPIAGVEEPAARREADSTDRSDGAIGDLVAALRRAERLIIFAGGGAVRSGAQDELLALAELLNAPVVTTVTGRGAIPDDHPLGLGPVWDRFGSLDDLARDADLVLCVGTRLTPLATRNAALPLHDRLAIVDLDPDGPARRYPSRIVVRADARTALRQVLTGLAAAPAHDSNATRSIAFASTAADRADRWRQTFKHGAPLVADLLDGLHRAVPRNTVVTCDMTVLGYWAQRFLPILRAGGLLSPYYFGSLGYGLPAAIGASAGAPDATVVAICGDAGFLMNSQEMASANQIGLAVHAVVVNDGGYAAVRADERRLNVGALRITDVTNPSFAKLADAYGWAYACVPARGDALADALRDAVREGRSSLTEVALDQPLPMPYEVTW